MIFVSAGHHPDKPGACYKEFCEHEEAKLWVSLITNLLGSDAMVVPTGVLRSKVAFINDRADRDKDVAVEIHFNSAKDSGGNHVGKGSETLYYPKSDKGKLAAQRIQDNLGVIFLPDRGVKEGYYQMNEDKGADFFLARTVCTSLIIEPEFIHRQAKINDKREDACKGIAESLYLISRGVDEDA